MAYTNGVTTYRETRVKTASQIQLIIMMYDEAVKNLDQSLEILDLNAGGRQIPGNIEKITRAVLKAQEIITELTVSLDFDEGGDIARNLFSLYTWFNKELLEANINHDVQRITSVRNQLNELRSAWIEITSKQNSETQGKAVTGVNIAG